MVSLEQTAPVHLARTMLKHCNHSKAWKTLGTFYSFARLLLCWFNLHMQTPMNSIRTLGREMVSNSLKADPYWAFHSEEEGEKTVCMTLAGPSYNPNWAWACLGNGEQWGARNVLGRVVVMKHCARVLWPSLTNRGRSVTGDSVTYSRHKIALPQWTCSLLSLQVREGDNSRARG